MQVLVLATVACLIISAANVSEGKVVVCYYNSQSFYRKGIAKYTINDIPPNLCTHLVYAFATLDINTLDLKTSDPYLDLDSGLGYYRKFTELKALDPNLKTLLSLGGANSVKGLFKKLVGDQQRIVQFSKQAAQFLETYGFDGLDVDWEFPTKSDRKGFVYLVKQLKKVFLSKGLLVTAAFGGTVRSGYDVLALKDYLDFFHIMSYDYHGSWEPTRADHLAPLYRRPSDFGNYNANATVYNYIAAGAPPDKLVLGIPTYGRTWKLTGTQTVPPAPADGTGSPGQYLHARGVLSYYEICDNVLKRGWTKVDDPERLIGPHAYQLPQWVGYDDPNMAKIKAEYAKMHGLAGIMFWEISLDDFNGICNLGQYPIITKGKEPL